MSAATDKAECRRYEHWLMPYVDDELDAVHALDLEGHLLRCGACKETVAFTRSMRCSVRRVARSCASPELRERMRAVLMESRAPVSEPVQQEPPLRARYAIPLAAAALFAILFGAIRLRSDDGRTAVAMNGLSSATVNGAVDFENWLDDLVQQHIDPPPPETTDPEVLSQFDPFVGVRVQPPRMSVVGAEWQGARMHRRAAMLQYKVFDRHRVTVYVFDPRRVPLRADRLRPRHMGVHNVYVGRVRGYSVAASEQNGVGYALASDLTEDENAELLVMAAR